VRLITGPTIALTIALTSQVSAQPLLDKIPDRHPAYINDPPPTVVRTIPISPVHTFEQRWEPAQRLIEEQAARRVAAEQNASAVNSVAPTPIPRPKVRPRPVQVADICTQHGRTKVFTNGGKSWRCK